MTDTNETYVCRYCAFAGAGHYCGRCGQPYKIKRISLSGLLHDVFHFFTHLDKGFGYTLKQLVIAPGHMQRAYVEGDRSRHQKPFSMFFICATLAALSRYWIFRALLNYYHTGNVAEANYFHEYMVVLMIAVLPLYALATYVLFYKSGFNYAETGVLILYTLSFFLLLAAVVALLKFIWPHFDTAYVELPILIVYNAVTFVNFFRESTRWIVVLKSILILSVVFFLIQLAEDFIVQVIS